MAREIYWLIIVISRRFRSNDVGVIEPAGGERLAIVNGRDSTAYC